MFSGYRCAFGAFFRTDLATPITITIAIAIASSGCTVASDSSAPTAPTAARASIALEIPEVLQPSLDLIDSDSRAVPFLDDAAGTWLRRTIRGVRLVDDLPPPVRARCCGPDGMIHWSTAWLPDPTDPRAVRMAAGILLHEGRHAEGYRHTCPDRRRDSTFAEGGAWAVHAAWLRQMGDRAPADSITAMEIGCRGEKRPRSGPSFFHW